MSGRLEKIYFRSPLFVQNWLISLYGYKLYRERYAGNHDRYLQELLETQWRQRGEIEDRMEKEFRRTWAHAVRTVPHYRDLVRRGDAPGEIRGRADLRRIPILSKEEIRENPERFVSSDFSIRRLIRIHTSGSSGKTLKIYVDRDSRRKGYAFFTRLKIWAGIEPGRPNATFAGRTIVPPEAQRPPFWRTNRKMNNVLYSSYHLCPENMTFYVEHLRRFQPHFIDSYPSSVFTLARHMKENRINGITPRAIITSSETLLEHQRAVVEEVFGCPVFDQYGSAEQVVFVSQCEAGAYHIHPEFGQVEFLRADGEAAEPGEAARLVCTGFTNRAMPLIRYETGDQGILAPEQACSCGRHFPVMRQIVGRTDDVLITPDGRRVGRLDPIFKGLQSVQEAQIVQEDLDRILLRIVPGKGFQEKDAQVLVWELTKRMGSRVKVQIEYCAEIPRSAAGKFRAVICRVPGG